ncbi:major facilitator superfamily transporter [Roridomyces roridus]|uniref:Major facilitator superfamily transporter n=1 Tax=Roridomyces roridus TaxID=1738132 RepID=A0AAD7C1K8_9AGAR|nr:major facilitator superfamily transporter [Roridomyces roridus]
MQDTSETAKPVSSSPPNEKASDIVERIQYPTGLRLSLISLALAMSQLVTALDNTIVAVAIPKITDQFHSLEDVGWYGSAYLLTGSAFQLFFGRLYSFLPQKWVYITAIAIFELGSLICAVAPTSTALIVGRAIAGLGCAGINTGCLIICAKAVPLERRSIFMGILGAVYWVGSVAGPLVGGALADRTSWRWCFYINLPLGAITVIVMGLFFKVPGGDNSSDEYKNLSFMDRVQKCDPWGTSIFMPCIICLLLALQWGGTKYPWNDRRIIALLVLFGVLLAVFMVIQSWKQENATVPPRIIKQRGVLAATAFAFALSGSFFSFIYLLPIYFQAVKGVTPIASGIDNLPMVLSIVISSLVVGGLITSIGYFTPFMYVATVFMAVGAGLLSTLTVHAPPGHWIGYQLIYGIGVGAGIQQPLMAVQAIMKPEDVATGTTLVLFLQTLGGTVFVSVSQNVLRSKLLSGLISRVPSINPSVILDGGATSLRTAVDGTLLPAVLDVYNDALVGAYYVAVAMAVFCVVGALGSEWKSVKRKKDDDLT